MPTSTIFARVLLVILLPLLPLNAQSLAPAAASAPADRELAERYESALTYYYRGDIKSARIEVLNVLQADPRHIGARILKGQIELISGNGAAAQDSFETARRLGAAEGLYLEPLAEAYIQQREFGRLYKTIVPGTREPALEATVHIARGKALLQQGRLPEAEEQFSIAEKLWPQAPEPRVGRAMIARRQGDTATAQQLLAEATSKTPEYAQAWFTRGALTSALGDQEAALAYYSAAIERNPNYVIARNARAALLLATEREELALEDIQFVLNIRPFDLEANYRYALVLARDGEMAAADLAMRRVGKGLDALGSEFIYQHPPSLFLYGLYKFQEGEYKEAKQALRQFLQFAPRDVGGNQLMGVLMARERNHDAVVELLEPIVAVTPDNPQLLALLGQAKMAQQKVGEATALFEQAIDLAPFNRQVRTQLALTRLAVGQQERAINELEEILQFDQASANVVVMLGFIYLNRGDADAALEWGQRVLKSEPGSAAGENLVGAAYLKMGKVAEAKAAFERSVAADPGNSNARFNLAELASAEGDREEVRRQLESIVKTDRRNVEALVRLARMALEDGDTKTAINWYEKVRIEQPTAVMNQLELFEIYLADGQLQQAKWLAEELASVYRDDLRVLLALGRARMAENKEAEAAVIFDRMALLAGHNPEELYRIALLQEAANDARGAHRSLQKALEEQPDFLPAMTGMCELEQRLGNTARALAVAGDIRKAHPDDPSGYQLAGQILLGNGQGAEAVTLLEEGLARGPNIDLERAVFLARLNTAEDDQAAQQAALDHYQRWLDQNPFDIEGRRTYAGALFRLGRIDESLQGYQALLEERPRDAQLHNSIAYVYLQKDDERAYTHARQAYNLAPNNPLVLDTYGWVLHRRGQNDRALTYLREASNIRPGISELRYHLGAVLYELRRFREARLELEAALERGEPFEGEQEARSLLAKIRGA